MTQFMDEASKLKILQRNFWTGFLLFPEHVEKFRQTWLNSSMATFSNEFNIKGLLYKDESKFEEEKLSTAMFTYTTEEFINRQKKFFTLNFLLTL